MFLFKKKLFFYIPFLYTIYTREKGTKGLIAYITKLPLAWILITIFDSRFAWENFAFGFFMLYALYEFGYIYNDCEAIKNEIKPTLRLTSAELSYYECHKINIYAVRIVFACFVFISMLVSHLNIFIIIYPLLIIPIFSIYNKVRTKWSLYIHIILMLLKHTSIIFVTLNAFDLPSCIFVLLYNPIPFYIELSAKGKFGYTNKILKKICIPIYDKYHIHLFRLYYQCIFAVITFLLILSGFFYYWYIYINLFYIVLMLVTLLLYGKKSS